MDKARNEGKLEICIGQESKLENIKCKLNEELKFQKASFSFLKGKEFYKGHQPEHQKTNRRQTKKPKHQIKTHTVNRFMNTNLLWVDLMATIKCLRTLNFSRHHCKNTKISHFLSTPHISCNSKNNLTNNLSIFCSIFMGGNRATHFFLFFIF